MSTSHPTLINQQSTSRLGSQVQEMRYALDLAGRPVLNNPYLIICINWTWVAIDSRASVGGAQQPSHSIPQVCESAAEDRRHQHLVVYCLGSSLGFYSVGISGLNPRPYVFGSRLQSLLGLVGVKKLGSWRAKV